MKRKKIFDLLKKFENYKSLLLVTKILKKHKFFLRTDFSRKISILRFFFKYSAEFYNYKYKLMYIDLYIFFHFLFFFKKKYFCKNIFYMFKPLFINLQRKFSKTHVTLEFLKNDDSESLRSLSEADVYLKYSNIFYLNIHHTEEIQKIDTNLKNLIFFNYLVTHYYKNNLFNNNKLLKFSNNANIFIYYARRIFIFLLVVK